MGSILSPSSNVPYSLELITCAYARVCGSFHTFFNYFFLDVNGARFEGFSLLFVFFVVLCVLGESSVFVSCEIFLFV